MSARYFDLLPYSDIMLSNLLNNADAIQIIKEHFSFTLPSIYVNLVPNKTTRVGVPRCWNISDLLNLVPLQLLVRLIRVKSGLVCMFWPIVPQVELL